MEDKGDMFQKEQRHGGSRRQGQSRVRARGDSDWGDYETEDLHEFCEQILSHDGRVTLQYSHHDRSRGGDAQRGGGRLSNHQRRSVSRNRFRSNDYGADHAEPRVYRYRHSWHSSERHESYQTLNNRKSKYISFSTSFSHACKKILFAGKDTQLFLTKRYT